MLNHQTRDQLLELKLTGMCEASDQQLAQPNTHDLAFEERASGCIEKTGA